MVPYLTSYQNTGDPFLGGLIKSGFNFLKGGVRSMIGGGGRVPQPYVPSTAPMVSGRMQFGPVQFNAGVSRTQTQVTAYNANLPVPAAGQKPAGYHVNKTGYYRQRVPGNPAAGAEWVPPGSTYVRNRRRNNANGRALNRALSRVSGFANQVSRARKASRAMKKI